MATSAQSYELVFRDKKDLKPTERATTTSTSTSETEASATDAQPPRASLLGLPTELLNYIVELIVVKDPDEGPTIADVYFKPLKGNRNRHVFRCSRPSPGLARTCTFLEAIALPMYYGQNTFSFRSSIHACRWLSLKRKKGMALIRRVKILFDVTDGDDEELIVEIELFLEEKTDKLVLDINCSFYTQACQRCRRILMNKIEDINGRTRQYMTGSGRLVALLRHLSKKANAKDWVCRCGCET
jgi:hypothetical protein